MWCKHCHQDVPVVGSQQLPDLCPRCERGFEPTRVIIERLPVRSELGTPVERMLDAETDRRLQALGRSIRKPLLGTPAMQPGERLWLDLPPKVRNGTQGATTDPRLRRDEELSPAQVQWGAWLATTFGLGLTLGGAVLIGMALWGELGEYWPWGVGITLTGQAILAAGLIWMLGSLWKTSRAAVSRLAACEHQLAAVHRSAEAIYGQRVSGASAFYGELARGASPTSLMSSLQGQVQQLATRLHH